MRNDMDMSGWVFVAFIAAILATGVFSVRACCIAEDTAFKRCAADCGGAGKVAESHAMPNPSCRCRGVEP